MSNKNKKSSLSIIEVIKPYLNEIYDKALFIPFPTDKLLEGITCYNKHRCLVPDDITNHSETMLANYGKWWINYSNQRRGTGPFESRDEAIGWFVRAGR